MLQPRTILSITQSGTVVDRSFTHLFLTVLKTTANTITNIKMRFAMPTVEKFERRSNCLKKSRPLKRLVFVFGGGSLL